MDTYAGTVDFMAPEIIKGECYGQEVDMWSIGVIAFMMLSGNVCFTGVND